MNCIQFTSSIVNVLRGCPLCVQASAINRQHITDCHDCDISAVRRIHFQTEKRRKNDDDDKNCCEGSKTDKTTLADWHIGAS